MGTRSVGVWFLCGCEVCTGASPVPGHECRVRVTNGGDAVVVLTCAYCLDSRVRTVSTHVCVLSQSTCAYCLDSRVRTVSTHMSVPSQYRTRGISPFSRHVSFGLHRPRLTRGNTAGDLPKGTDMSSPRRFRKLGIGATLAASLFLAACGGNGDSSTSGESNAPAASAGTTADEIIIGTTNEPTSFQRNVGGSSGISETTTRNVY